MRPAPRRQGTPLTGWAKPALLGARAGPASFRGDHGPWWAQDGPWAHEWMTLGTQASSAATQAHESDQGAKGGTMRIALDAMGGDQAPQVTVEGAVWAAREYGVEVALVGQEDVLTAQLENNEGS